MTPNNNILEELRELKSGLAAISRQNIFQVPVGYFDGFPAEMMNKVRALESGKEGKKTNFLSPFPGNLSKQSPYSAPAGYFDNLPEQLLKRVKAAEMDNAAQELASLSPLLNKISKQVPYTLPEGYFDNVEEKLRPIISIGADQSVTEELESISPLLNSLKRRPPYTVPERYFENLQPAVINENGLQETRVISITSRKWFRYAAAALVIGFVATISLLLLNKPNGPDPTDKSFAWVQKNMKKVSTDDINEFVELASAGTNDVTKTGSKDELNKLLKDVSDKEIQDFLNDTQVAESEDDLILN